MYSAVDLLIDMLYSQIIINIRYAKIFWFLHILHCYIYIVKGLGVSITLHDKS